MWRTGRGRQLQVIWDFKLPKFERSKFKVYTCNCTYGSANNVGNAVS